MLELLQSTSTYSVSAVGVPIQNLHAIKTAGILVVPTIIADRQLFHEYVPSARLPEQAINEVSSLLSEHKAFLQRAQVTIRSSVVAPYAGLLEEITVDRDQPSLRYGIEAIYRSWFDEMARANRCVYDIEEAGSTPALCIQPAYSDVLRIATRTGFGEVTNATNYNRSAHNTIEHFCPAYSDLLGRIEAVMAYPTEVVITNDEAPAVIDAKRDLITDIGLWRTLTELLRNGLISEFDYLQRISADTLVQFVALAFSDPDSIVLDHGLAASPGTAIGHLCMLNNDYRSYRRKDLADCIVVMGDLHPDAIDVINNCAGVLATTGGMTCHAAVACRGLAKPLVINHCLSIDRSSRTLHHPMLTSHLDNSWYACINGSSGAISFSRNPALTARYEVNEDCAPYLDQVIRALQRCDDIAKFSSETVESQLHFARLRSELRKVGAME